MATPIPSLNVEQCRHIAQSYRAVSTIKRLCSRNFSTADVKEIPILVEAIKTVSASFELVPLGSFPLSWYCLVRQARETGFECLRLILQKYGLAVEHSIASQKPVTVAQATTALCHLSVQIPFRVHEELRTHEGIVGPFSLRGLTSATFEVIVMCVEAYMAVQCIWNNSTTFDLSASYDSSGDHDKKKVVLPNPDDGDISRDTESWQLEFMDLIIASIPGSPAAAARAGGHLGRCTPPATGRDLRRSTAGTYQAVWV